MKRVLIFGTTLCALITLTLILAVSNGCAEQSTEKSIKLSDAQVENIVRRSYQYVAMYNVNNKAAMDPSNPINTGGWNLLKANTRLLDHTMNAIARPNNDTLYATATLDLRHDPVILYTPAFDSKYVSLMVTGYDHYVNIPMSTQQGDFAKPSRIMFYTKRTEGYDGGRVEGVDKIAEMTGDFVSAVYRIMPHQADAARMQRNLEAMKAIKVLTLSEYRGDEAKPIDEIKFPPFGKTDFDIFENNLLEVMQFVFNHTTFDEKDALDKELLAIYAPLGLVPGRTYDHTKVAAIDGARFRKVAEAVAKRELAKATDQGFQSRAEFALFQPKGKMTLDMLLFQSVLGPIGVPASEAIYKQIATKDGSPMNAQHDYVIRMKKNELPPAKAFWSATLYDTKNGFFIPNEHKKYSVGENGGMKLNKDGGIEIYIAEKKPAGVPEENWLPINRGDYNMDVQMRIYEPDLERYKKWSPPKAERLAAASTPTTGGVANHSLQYAIPQGQWQRPDGGYLLEIKGVYDHGAMDDVCLNPNPIHVAKAQATRTDDELKVLVELRDVNYPGLTYNLMYGLADDQLEGSYCQAVAGETYKVFFQRVN